MYIPKKHGAKIDIMDCWHIIDTKIESHYYVNFDPLFGIYIGLRDNTYDVSFNISVFFQSRAYHEKIQLTIILTFKKRVSKHCLKQFVLTYHMLQKVKKVMYFLWPRWKLEAVYMHL